VQSNVKTVSSSFYGKLSNFVTFLPQIKLLNSIAFDFDVDFHRNDNVSVLVMRTPAKFYVKKSSKLIVTCKPRDMPNSKIYGTNSKK
jgi:hypothetical protein